MAGERPDQVFSIFKRGNRAGIENRPRGGVEHLHLLGTRSEPVPIQHIDRHIVRLLIGQIDVDEEVISGA